MLDELQDGLLLKQIGGYRKHCDEECRLSSYAPEPVAQGRCTSGN